ncbi:RNA polymerase sigma factor [Steroidobacter sp.]|uniref:RNA polymerase sigma factor n=1 Tax=Steroidobacter sp. TaxID=1978227 RepID=UPI001A418954|nr:sigma-70 family RNA polymerase sigma factor [Steroidobacter sp.]MBL8268829.1 sigma-70 family RNA polymerase sigma factor [Steroidobacter sp.]
MSALSRRLRRPLEQFFVRRLGVGPEIDDLVQEVFERLLRQKRLDAVDRLDGYVFTVAANLLRDRVRKHSAQGGRDVALDCIPDLSDNITPERVLIGKDSLNRFLAAIAELPERTRNVLMLRRFEGLEFKAIALQLGISVSAVEKHMLRAMDELSRRLDLE